MSASRDPSEKITFLFTPMGKLTQRIRETPLPEQSAVPHRTPLNGSKVLKSSELRETAHRPGLVREYRIREIQHAPAPIPAAPPIASHLARSEHHLQRQRQALEGLSRNLQELGEIEKRLQFMLLELEDLLKG
ncbi:MAG: hypothetical protein KGQ59_05085 [Bdellovibrionales bacterium]|nr:hypothetical protein [Bdellovibrionales bacterium]